MEWRHAYSKLRSGLRGAYPTGRAPTDKAVQSTEWNIKARLQNEEHRQRMRSADGNWGAAIIAEKHHWRGRGYEATPPYIIVMSAMASAVIQSIIMGGQNLPQYLSWENITVPFFPVAFSDNPQSIDVATSASVYGVRHWKNCEVVSCHPKLLAVKKNRWEIDSHSSIRVNCDFVSWITFER